MFKRQEESQEKGDQMLNQQEATTQGSKLIEESNICMLGTNGEDGFPNIKAMMNLKHEGLQKMQRRY